MGRLSGNPGAGLSRAARRTGWELGRGLDWFERQYGSLGWVMAGAALLALVAWRVEQDQVRQLAVVQAQLRSLPGPATRVAMPDAGRLRLRAFEQHLLAYEAVPDVVQDLVRLAEQQGLTMQSGEYRMQADPVGQFMRYRMALPVKGNGQAVYRFLLRALVAQPALALDSVQFKRELDTADLEARIDWVVLTRMPERRGPEAPQGLP